MVAASATSMSSLRRWKKGVSERQNVEGTASVAGRSRCRPPNRLRGLSPSHRRVYAVARRASWTLRAPGSRLLLAMAGHGAWYGARGRAGTRGHRRRAKHDQRSTPGVLLSGHPADGDRAVEHLRVPGHLDTLAPLCFGLPRLAVSRLPRDAPDGTVVCCPRCLAQPKGETLRPFIGQEVFQEIPSAPDSLPALEC